MQVSGGEEPILRHSMHSRRAYGRVSIRTNLLHLNGLIYMSDSHTTVNHLAHSPNKYVALFLIRTIHLRDLKVMSSARLI